MSALDIFVLFVLAVMFIVGMGMMVAGAIMLTSGKGQIDARDARRFRSIKRRLGK